MLKLYSKYLKRYSGKIGLILLFMAIFTTTLMALPTLSKSVIDKGALSGNTDEIVKYALIMAVVAVVAVISGIANNFYVSSVVMGATRDMRDSLFERVIHFSQEDEDKIGTASLISRQSKDILTTQTIMVQMFQMMLQAPLMCIAGIILAISTSVSLSWIIAVLLPLAAITIGIAIHKTQPIFRANQKKIDRVNGVMRETLNGMRVIRAFNREAYEIERFAGVSDDLMNNVEKGYKLMNLLMPMIVFFANGSNILILLFGADYMKRGLATYGDVQAFVQYTTMILMAFMIASMFLMLMPNAQASAERINEVWEFDPSITDKEQTVKLPEVGNASITVEHMSYRF